MESSNSRVILPARRRILQISHSEDQPSGLLKRPAKGNDVTEKTPFLEQPSTSAGQTKKFSANVRLQTSRKMPFVEQPTTSTSAGSTKKFSVNARLQMYRKTLASKQNENVKMHMLNSKGEIANVRSLKRPSDSVDERLKKCKVLNICDDKNKSDLGENKIQCSASRNISILDDNDDMEMDWSPVNEQELLTNIGQLRENYTDILSYKTPVQEYFSNSTVHIPYNTSFLKDTFIVVDTNVFLSHLKVVADLMEVKLNGMEKAVILIPWMVIQELDYIKDGRGCKKTLQSSAQKAICFINQMLLVKDSNFKGQSAVDAAQDSIQSKNPDDCILACCMQVCERGNRAILLSNDRNLRNKALIHAIPAYSTDEIFKALEVRLPSKTSNTEKIINKNETVRNHLTNLLNAILQTEGKSCYGEYYARMGTFKNAPWDLQGCLAKFEKLWLPIFREKLPKHFLKSVQDFRNFLRNCRNGKNECDIQRLTNYALDICTHLKNNLTDYSASINKCVDDIVSTNK